MNPFMDTFKALELDLRIELKLSEREHMSFNEMVHRSHRRVFKSAYHLEVLENAAQLRNILAHKNDLATPHPAFLEAFLKVSKRILKPLKAMHIMTPMQAVFNVHLKTTLDAAMNVMRSHHVAHLPVIDAGVCIGIFNDGTLFYALENSQSLEVTLKTPIERFADVLFIESHPRYHYEYVARTTTLDAIADHFSDFLTKDDKHLELIIVTEHGTMHETMLGLISPEDLLHAYMHD